MGTPESGEEQIRRVRRFCLAMPQTSEKLSHGEPTFFVHKKVFAMISNHHHNDGHVSVCVPAEPGMQDLMIHSAPEKYYKPPYVGVRGWVGVELDQVSDEELGMHLSEAWRLIASKKKRA